ncbi:hypothetical protein PVE_R2G0600 [Pseudomonas veronii 1YdBTEX2]|uniref:Uncharacterized protein n=1 Tax=Pseudomonas veronii 1YdBTEX2 TaxID=1295141 RepID=A0A1D3K8H3_PSEVE|nr:hypothetical protein PVE_R2G0600 [Pseudomonas veronii 1YdBTEX2]
MIMCAVSTTSYSKSAIEFQQWGLAADTTHAHQNPGRDPQNEQSALGRPMVVQRYRKPIRAIFDISPTGGSVMTYWSCG